MKNNRKIAGIILFLFLIILNILAFAIPHKHTATFWCGYLFTTVAFLFQVLFTFLALGDSKSIKKVFLGISIIHYGLIYLILQSILGLIFIFIPSINIILATVSSALLLCIYLIIIATALIGRNLVADIDTKNKVKTFFIKSLLVDVETLEEKAETPEMKVLISSLSEQVKYSDPMSSDVLQNVEGRISDKYNLLEAAVVASDVEAAKIICKDLDVLFTERNKKCKLLK